MLAVAGSVSSSVTLTAAPRW